jgi:3-oxoacyl-[acyl-carrier-protein] synthase III
MAVETRIPRARILGTGSYLPETVVDNAALERDLLTTDAWIRERTGIERRRRAAPGETTSDMAAAAGRAALAAAGIGPADLHMIIVATTSGDSPMPATAVHVQQKLGAELIPSFDLAASFAGLVYALAIADQFISAGTARNILVIGADTLSRLAEPTDRTTVPLFGDGAGALVVGSALGDGRGILSATMRADGKQAAHLQIPGGGSAEPLTVDRLAEGRHYLQMSGPELFQGTLDLLVTQSEAALAAAGLAVAELDWVVPHQANRHLVDRHAERLGHPRHRFIENLAEVGNTGAGSIAIALDEAIRDGRIQPGQSVLLCALGGGLAWGTAVVRV